MIRCPECATEVQPTWDWCHACGWDPEGLRPAGWAPTAPMPLAAPPPAGRGSGRPPPLAPGIGAGPGSAHAGYGATPLPPSATVRSGRSTGTSVALVLLGVGGCFVGVIVILVLAVTFLGTAADAPRFSSIDGAITADADGVPVDAAWTRFTSADGSYSIDFPVPPVVAEVPVDDPGVARAQEVNATVNGLEYGLAFFEFAPGYEFPDPAANLDLLVDRTLPSLDITLTGKVPGNYAYSTSVSFSGKSTRTGGLVEGVAFLSGNRVYLLLTAGPPGFPAEAERFLGSLTLG